MYFQQIIFRLSKRDNIQVLQRVISEVACGL